MIKKFSHQAIHITCMKSLSNAFQKKKEEVENFYPQSYKLNFFSPPPQKKLKVQTDSKIKYDGSKYQYTSLIKY